MRPYTAPLGRARAFVFEHGPKTMGMRRTHRKPHDQFMRRVEHKRARLYARREVREEAALAEMPTCSARGPYNALCDLDPGHGHDHAGWATYRGKDYGRIYWWTNHVVDYPYYRQEI